MCGLFGIMGPGIKDEDIAIFHDLMHISSFRGLNGTGVVLGRAPETKPRVYKQTGDFLYWRYTLEDDEKKDISSIMNNFLVGHVRALTSGKVSLDATHPFTEGSVIGVHNGTMQDKYNWEKEGFHSDSHKFLSQINKVGLQAAVKELDEKDGFSVVWYNTKDHKLHFARNRLRTMFFCANPTRHVVYWASEDIFLRTVLARFFITPDDTWKTVEGFEYTFDPKNVKKGKDILWNTKEFEEPKSAILSNNANTNEHGVPYCDV